MLCTRATLAPPNSSIRSPVSSRASSTDGSVCCPLGSSAIDLLCQQLARRARGIELALHAPREQRRALGVVGPPLLQPSPHSRRRDPQALFGGVAGAALLQGPPRLDVGAML